MAKIVGLPKLSPTMEEGTLAKWVAKEGDTIDVDDLLAEVETDKATMEFRSFDKGVLLKILAEEGETLEPDTPVAIIGEKGEDIAALIEEAKSAGGGGSESKSESKSDSKSESESESEPKSEPEPKAETQKPKRPSGDRIFASPLVRKTAREEDVDLADVKGSGPHGRIIKRDLDAYLEGGGAKRQAPSGGSGWERKPPVVEKASQMRKAIARRLTESKQTVPHFYLTIDVDASGLVATRKEMNANLVDEKVSFNDLVIKAAAMALRRFPRANASWVDGEIHWHQVVDISVAVAVQDGLVTPVVRDADRKGVLAISMEVRELAARARDKKLKPEEMQNGTFSISNLGMYGVQEFAAVINPPEGALLAVGALRDAPTVRDGQLVAGKKMKVTLSCDHRVVDGAVGAQYLQHLQRFLETPSTMLL
ncbi:MAG: pyruvate dehydrogenase complex dihydrolipoamide acetyltransferase [Deltaproteobacteria bacterium]|nr:pyruvate dehydrogenase complex dihydrolipoamide acetyltransferase [Deltaproteobacteria bacterium]